MYSAPPQYVHSTSGLLPSGGLPVDTIAMQPYPPQQQHQDPYFTNTGNNYSHQSFDNKTFIASPPKHAHKNPEEDAPRRAHYPRLRLKKLLIRFLPILVVNTILGALFAYILKFYGDKKVLMPTDRRLFNVASLFLAAALSMGIGFLLGEVGVMFRGSMMGKSDNTKEEVRINHKRTFHSRLFSCPDRVAKSVWAREHSRSSNPADEDKNNLDCTYPPWHPRFLRFTRAVPHPPKSLYPRNNSVMAIRSRKSPWSPQCWFNWSHIRCRGGRCRDCGCIARHFVAGSRECDAE